MNLPYTEDEMLAALKQNNVPGTRAVMVRGFQVSRKAITMTLNERRLKVAPPAVAPVKIQPVRIPATMAEPALKSIAATPSPVPYSMEHAQKWKDTGDHIKTYVIVWIEKDGKPKCDKYAAKGAAQALLIHHGATRETGVIAVICVI